MTNPIEIIYRIPTIQEEFELAMAAFGDKDFFVANGYSDVVYPTEEELDGSFFASQFDESFYYPGVKNLSEGYSRLREFLSLVLNSCAFSMITFPKKIEIVPTKYGSGGRYDPDSETPKVIIRVNKMGEPKFRDVARTQMHEIMHLFLQRFVNEFLVTHRMKECLVDFMVSNFVSSEELGCCSYPRKDGERLYVLGGHLIAEYDVHKGFYDPNVWYPGLLNHLGVEEYIRLVAGLEQGLQYNCNLCLGFYI